MSTSTRPRHRKPRSSTFNRYVGVGIAVGGMALGGGGLALFQAPQASADSGGSSGGSCAAIQVLGNCGAGNVGGNGVTLQNNQVNLQLGLSNISAQSVRNSGNSSGGYGNKNVAVGGPSSTPGLIQVGGNRGAGNVGGNLLTAQNNQVNLQLGAENRSRQTIKGSGNQSTGAGNFNLSLP